MKQTWFENRVIDAAQSNLNYGVNKSLYVAANNGGTLNTACPSHVAFLTQLGMGRDRTGEVDPAWTTAIYKFYSSIRAANSSRSYFNQMQVSKYVHVVRLAYACEAMLNKYYRMALKYDSVDSRVPVALFTTHGINAEDVASNLADLKAFGLVFAQQIRSALPLKMNLLERTQWLFSNVFTDSDDAKANTFDFSLNAPAPKGRTAYQLPDDNSSIRYLSIGDYPDGINVDSLSKLQKVVSGVRQFMDSVLTSQNIIRIATEIKKAYGGEWYMPTLDWSDKPLEYVYDQDILTEIQNATIGFHKTTYVETAWGVNYTNYLEATTDYYPVPNTLRDLFMNTPVLVNSYRDSVTEAETMEYTRFTHQMSQSAEPDVVTTVTVGTEELVSSISYISHKVPNFTGIDSINNYVQLGIFDQFQYFITNSGTSIPGPGRTLMAWSSLDWAPRTIQIYYNSSSNTGHIAAPLWDFNNYAVVSNTDVYTLSAINFNAIYSLLYTPEIKPQAKWESKKSYDNKRDKQNDKPKDKGDAKDK